jgi:hypothetical protein
MLRRMTGVRERWELPREEGNVTMTELWTFRIVEFDRPPQVAGFDVEASDGHVGKVDEATYETGGSYIVVDTGFWIFGKKRMIPARAVERIDADNKTLHVSLTKDAIKRAPDYEEARRNEAEFREQHSEYYGPL